MASSQNNFNYKNEYIEKRYVLDDVLDETIDSDEIEEKIEKNNLSNDFLTRFHELFDMGLYAESLEMLHNAVEEKESKIEKGVLIHTVFKDLTENFESLIESDKMGLFTKNFVQFINNKPDFMDKLVTSFDDTDVSILFVYAIKEELFDEAQFFLPYLKNKNLNKFPSTIKELIENKKEKSLFFLLDNLDQIHYSDDAFLRLCTDMNFSFISTLIDKYNFSIKSREVYINDKSIGADFLYNIVKNKNIKNFCELINNYGTDINWGTSYNFGRIRVSIFDIMEKDSIALDFYSVMLDIPYLKPVYVNKIADYILNNESIIEIAYQTDIYDRLFSHVSFDANITSLGPNHLLYNILATIGVNARSISSNTVLSEGYYKIIDSYFTQRGNQPIAPNAEYHILGAAIYLAKEIDIPLSRDVLSLILKNYKNLINKPNPNGTLPINQVEEKKNPFLYKLLLSNGAISKNDIGFWASLFGKKRSEYFYEPEEEKIIVKEKPGDVNELSIKIKNDFREMKTLIDNPLCDPTIKMRCENMFLYADGLAKKISKYNIVSSYEETRFLSENFSNYLKKSLQTYINLCDVTVDFSNDSSQEKKLIKAKEKCEEQITLLEKQLDLIIENVSSSVEKTALTKVSVRTKILKEQFQNNESLIKPMINQNDSIDENEIDIINDSKRKMKL